jgi:hypothetical protein
MAGPLPPTIRAALDALAFSSVWLAAAAGGLCAAASLAMGFPPAASVVAMACAGTLVVYNVDRLRDLERDRATTPDRSAFVARHAAVLTGLAVAATLVALGLAVTLGSRPVLLLAPVLVLGLAHRRLKRLPFAKAAYLATAWLAVSVGLPAVVTGGGSHAGWVAAVLAAALLANAIASNVRDGEAALARLGPRAPLRIARALAALGILLGALGPPPVRPLAAVPALTLVSLLGFRPSERYGLIVVDGALLAGALVAIGMLSRSAG